MLYPIILYIDATSKNIGKVKDAKWPNFSAAGYAFLSSIFIWIAIPIVAIYLFKRKELIERAKANPVTLSTFKKSITILGLLFIRFIAAAAIPTTSDENRQQILMQSFGFM